MQLTLGRDRPGKLTFSICMPKHQRPDRCHTPETVYLPVRCAYVKFLLRSAIRQGQK